MLNRKKPYLLQKLKTYLAKNHTGCEIVWHGKNLFVTGNAGTKFFNKVLLRESIEFEKTYIRILCTNSNTYIDTQVNTLELLIEKLQKFGVLCSEQ